MKAVVADAQDSFSVVDVDLAPPKVGEVLVRMAATGVCHSDLSIVNGTIPSPFPTVLGHEGAGIVEEVGEGVTNVSPGDHVILSFIPHCGECFHCVRDEPYLCSVAKQDGNLLDGTTRVSRNGEPVFVMSFLGTWPSTRWRPRSAWSRWRRTCRSRPPPSSVAGSPPGSGPRSRPRRCAPARRWRCGAAGGVGLSVVQGARIAGASRIVAVDLSAEKMEMPDGSGPPTP